MTIPYGGFEKRGLPGSSCKATKYWEPDINIFGSVYCNTPSYIALHCLRTCQSFIKNKNKQSTQHINRSSENVHKLAQSSWFCQISFKYFNRNHCLSLNLGACLCLCVGVSVFRKKSSGSSHNHVLTEFDLFEVASSYI